jgi:hypothetical protein
LPEACGDGGKVLLFSQYVETLAWLRGELAEYAPLLYTGNVSEGVRERAIELFQNDQEHRVFLISLRAGGIGLNLTRALRRALRSLVEPGGGPSGGGGPRLPHWAAPHGIRASPAER